MTTFDTTAADDQAEMFTAPAPAQAAPTYPNLRSTKLLLEFLRLSYIRDTSRPGGVFVDEIAVNGDWGQGRRCDALYAGFTNASGRILIGHELKVSRADWRHELDQADKADTWADACHEWWVVAPGTDIVDPSSVPAGWGLMVPNGRGKNRMLKVVEATRKPADFAPPWWAVRSLMARYDTLRSGEILSRVKDLSEDRIRSVEQNAEMKIRNAERQCTPEQSRDIDTIAAFREAGIELGRYQGGRGASPKLTPEAVQPVLQQLLDGAAMAAITAGIVQDRWKTNILTEIQQKAADLQQLLDGLGRKPLRSP